MKEIITATPQQLNYLIGIERSLHGAKCTKQLIKETQLNEVQINDEINNTVFISDIEMAKMMEGGAKGLYNELVFPIIEDKKTTDEDMKKLALETIEDVKNTIYKWE